MAAATKKSIYDWTSADSECPSDLVVNAGSVPVVIACDGQDAPVRMMPPTVYQGDRRQGAYFAGLVNVAVGLQFVRSVSLERLAELDTIRRKRTGDIQPEWIQDAWKKKAQTVK